MNILIKFLAFPAFAIFIYVVVDKILLYGMNTLLPVLPQAVLYFGSKSCLFSAINIFLKIIIYGWILKQILSYVRTL